MSAEYKGQDPLDIAKQAERDLNSHSAKAGHDASNSNVQKSYGASDSTTESGVDASVAHKFPGADVQYGSAASGAGDNREIPVEEGGDIQKGTGRATKAKDFEGVGGPEDKSALHAQANPGDDSVRTNVK